MLARIDDREPALLLSGWVGKVEFWSAASRLRHDGGCVHYDSKDWFRSYIMLRVCRISSSAPPLSLFGISGGGGGKPSSFLTIKTTYVWT